MYLHVQIAVTSQTGHKADVVFDHKYNLDTQLHVHMEAKIFKISCPSGSHLKLYVLLDFHSLLSQWSPSRFHTQHCALFSSSLNILHKHFR